MTLDEDLAGLDEAFKMRLANLEGYITCQQTNKAFENADSSWYFRRNSPQNEVKTQDKAQMFDTKYQKTAVSIMEQAKEKFLVAFKSINYKQGMSDGTWKTDDYTYQYRLEITGRMNNAEKDSTFIFLSNIENITFDQAWKAAGFSSNMDDYFDVEVAKFVGMK